MQVKRAQNRILNWDANASYGLLPEVLECFNSETELGLNPSSIHRAGQKARAIIEEARENLAALIKLPKSARIIFTSGATEANNLALHLAIELGKFKGGTKVLSGKAEHPSVLEPLAYYERKGQKLLLLAPNASGEIDPDVVNQHLTAETSLVSLMLANNEIGTLFSWEAHHARIRKSAPNALLHCDAVQALGKLPIQFETLGVDLLSLSGHKIGALTGVGALVVSERVVNGALIRGGPQESRWRAGTENVLGIKSFGIAAACLQQNMGERVGMMCAQRDRIAAALLSRISGAALSTQSKNILPNTLNVFIPGVTADDLIVALDLEGLAVSSGAACASGKPEPSHVLMAMGKSAEQARQSIRISVRGDDSESDVHWGIEQIITAVARMRGVRLNAA